MKAILETRRVVRTKFYFYVFLNILIIVYYFCPNGRSLLLSLDCISGVKGTDLIPIFLTGTSLSLQTYFFSQILHVYTRP